MLGHGGDFGHVAAHGFSEVTTFAKSGPPLPRFSHFCPAHSPHAPFRLVPWGTNRGGVWRRGSVAVLNLRSFRCFRAGPLYAEARTGEALAIQPRMRHSYLVSFALLWVRWAGTVAADVITPGWIALAAAAPPSAPLLLYLRVLFFLELVLLVFAPVG